MNDPRHDEFEPLDDEGVSGLYRQTRDVDPPAGLDQRILRAARTAVNRPPTLGKPWPKPHRARNWTLSLALAATVALAVGLIRVAPPVGESSGISAQLEEKAARFQAESAAGKDAPKANSAQSSIVDSAARVDRAPPASIPPAASAVGALQDAPQPIPVAPLATPKASVNKQRSHPLPSPNTPTENNEVTEATSPLRDQTPPRSPAKWLAEIAELRRQGRTVEAEARLSEFLRHYYNRRPDPEAEPP
jgi:hypothetical protein